MQTLDSGEYVIDEITTGLTLTISNPGTLTINSFSYTSTAVDAVIYLTFDVTPTVKYETDGYIEVIGSDPYVSSSGTPLCTAIIGFIGSDRFCTNLNTYTIDYGRNIGTTDS